jgi:hypothetical protein
MVTQLMQSDTFMARERKTRAEPVSLDSLQAARNHLRQALENLDELIERMERGGVESLTLQWKTRRDAAKDWFLFSTGLERSFESELLRLSSENLGQTVKERDRKNRDK